MIIVGHIYVLVVVGVAITETAAAVMARRVEALSIQARQLRRGMIHIKSQSRRHLLLPGA